MQTKRRLLCIVALLLALLFALPTRAGAASAIRLADFGDRGLIVYAKHARDAAMLKALIAVDLAEGRSISSVDEAAVGRVAGSMRQSHEATVSMYIAYYTANDAHKKRIAAQAERLGDIGYVFSNKVFPIPQGHEVWYGDSWGAPRGDNGERGHQGIDLAVGYGVPILSMGDGVIEAIGWTTLGGWRIGVRDRDGLYYYYAHMSSFAPGMKAGVKVLAGQVIGYVGDSGYGPQGTTGIMSPHLHVCVYEGYPKKACNPHALLNWTASPLVNVPL